MTTALSAEQRTLLERFVQRARVWVEEDLASALEGRFGVHADGRIESATSLSLSGAELAVRADLLEIVEYLRAEGEGAQGSIDRLVREATFTHTNRLVAVRVAEAIGLLPETMAKGVSSTGFRDFTELVPTVADTEWDRFAVFIRLCGDELAVDVPALFDPRNPLLELEVSESVLERVIEAMQELPAEVWVAPDALGWAYQFFNTGEERREMRESSAPRNSRELAVRNQFFTPNYVVEFLVQNGLGAHLAAGYPELADDLPLLVEVPTERIEVDLHEVSVLDPACGSGHFLLGAYDVLERAWRLAGADADQAAPHIVRSLWGIDIDPRATQIAQAAVMFRARRHCRATRLPVANVICARALPLGPQAEEFVATLPERVGRAVRRVAAELTDAPVLGPLLKIEERLNREVRDVFGTGSSEGTLPEVESTTEDVESEVLAALRQIADSTTSSAAQRLFVAEAHDAVHFVEAMTRRYTAVLMNPPFGEPVPSTKSYLKAAYSWAPSTVDLYALFVGRGVQLANDLGTCGAITNRSGLFLTTFEDWRRAILLGQNLRTLVDLGLGVMEQALVEAAAYVIGGSKVQASTFIRLTRERDRSSGLRAVAEHARIDIDDERVVKVRPNAFLSLPTASIAYWLHPRLVSLFETLGPLQEFADVRTGLSTGDDFQFVRAFWEVDPETVVNGEADARWVPFAKGGEYSPYWSDIHLVLDWQDDGEHLRGFDGSTFRNPDYYFRSGLTWSVRTASGFSPRLLPHGCVFGHKGNFIGSADDFYTLAVLCSLVAQACIAAQMPAADETTSGGASKSYEVGTIRSVPVVGSFSEPIGDLAHQLAVLTAAQDEGDELARRFIAPSARPEVERLAILDVAHQMQLAVAAEYGIAEHELANVLSCAGLPLSYPEQGNDEEIVRLYSSSLDDVIDEMVRLRGGMRELVNKSYLADRRIEVIAHGLEVSPRTIARVVQERGLRAPGELEDRALRLASYLVGVAFGRWDVRVGRDSSRAVVTDDLLAPPARYSPGMLLDDTGRPPATPPVEYPLAFPESGVLLDQHGHEWDIEAAVLKAAEELHGGTDELQQALSVLMPRPSLSGFLRSQFFKQHLSMYSMSRRKAPIYWQLQVPSKLWGVWLYAPKLSREMLFAVVREAEQRERLANQQIAYLQREASAGGGGRSASALAKELETEQKLAVELASFKAEAERIANLGWEPHLDDGMVLNAAPLADLFPAWKDAAMYRKELRAGKYEWATVARYADRL